jgi:hypothetical protein
VSSGSEGNLEKTGRANRGEQFPLAFLATPFCGNAKKGFHGYGKPSGFAKAAPAKSSLVVDTDRGQKSSVPGFGRVDCG